MKLFEKKWKQYIEPALYLNEGMKTADDLPDGVKIIISAQDEESMHAFYAYDDEHDYAGRRILSNDRNGLPYGNIEFGKPLNYQGKCLDGFLIIQTSDTLKGWGPLLYDVVIEYCSMKAGGLLSDRSDVSPAAKNVWNYYLNNRKDVKHKQLDNLKNELTPTEKDNCMQDSAVSDKGEGEWFNSSLSKIYVKEPKTIDFLMSLEKIEIIEEYY